MKLLIAIIRPGQLEQVQNELKDVLDEQDNFRLTIEQVEGHGRQEGRSEVYRGRRIVPHLVEKIQVTIALNDDYVEPAIEAIVRGARTGKVGDGKILVLPMEDCIRIRTGERGPGAI